MMFLLARNIIQHPIELLFPKTNSSKPSLPFQYFEAFLLVHLELTSSFQVSDEVADAYKGFNINCQMHMILCPTNSMEVDPFVIVASLLDKTMGLRLEWGG